MQHCGFCETKRNETSKPGGGTTEKLGGGVRPASKTLTLFMTKICDIPYPIYDLNKNSNPYFWPGARFSKAPETFRARKAIFSSSVSKNGELYTPEISCMKGTSFHIKNAWIKQLCNLKVRDFATAFRVQKLFGTFEKRAIDL